MLILRYCDNHGALTNGYAARLGCTRTGVGEDTPVGSTLNIRLGENEVFWVENVVPWFRPGNSRRNNCCFCCYWICIWIGSKLGGATGRVALVIRVDAFIPRAYKVILAKSNRQYEDYIAEVRSQF